MEARDLMFPVWQLPYFGALAEGSPETLRERVDDKERAIIVRLAQLVSRPEREMEHFAIRDALDALYVIKLKIGSISLIRWPSRLRPLESQP
jgi:hypothetical protein